MRKMPPEFYQYNVAGLRSMPLDITILPINRIGGQDQPSLPGLMAAVPPRNAARGRDQDRLLVYLVLTGKAVLSSGECVQAASRAAVAFYATPGTITSALRAAAEAVNKYLHQRNVSSPAPGMYAVGVLALGAIREAQFTLLLSGPMHVFVLGATGARHIFDTLSGRGLGLSDVAPYYLAQAGLHFGDRILICGNPPSAWEAAARDASPASLEATRRRLVAMLKDDMSAALLEVTEGAGMLTVQRLAAEDETAGLPLAFHKVPADTQGHPVSNAAAAVEIPTAPLEEMTNAAPLAASSSEGAPTSGPSAYAIPPESPERQSPPTQDAETEPPIAVAGDRSVSLEMPAKRGPWIPSERSRQAAKTAAGVLHASHEVSGKISEGVQRFLPRLLPGSDQNPWAFSSPAMMFIAVLVPLLVVTVASAVYFRYGRSVQYEQYLVQAQDAHAQAITLVDAVAQREAWQRELFYLDKAEAYAETDVTRGLRAEAQHSLDQLLGISRLQFQPALSNNVGIQVARLAAGDNDLYLLDAQRGSVMHLALTNAGFEVDKAFSCAPGSYGDYTVGPMVDILAMPDINTINATVIGVDAAGNLLYCAPGQVAQAIPLPPPDTNWGRVKAFTLDGGSLYVLDARAHAVWVYVGKDGAFVDRPYFFFGGQIPELEDAIDLAVTGDDLFVLHSDGRMSTCSYSRIESVPTRCVDPAVLVNPLPAYQDQDLFLQAHFTQMMFSPAPDATLLMLDSDGQGVFRIAPRSLELQGQLRPVPGRLNPLPQGQVTAMAISPNHVLYFAVQDRIYFASDAP
jgi:hypothetical protein